MKLIIATVLALSVLSASAFAADMPVVAKCRDGKSWHSDSKEHRGVCSGHGGVESWTDGTPVKGKGRKSYVD